MAGGVGFLFGEEGAALYPKGLAFVEAWRIGMASRSEGFALENVVVNRDSGEKRGKDFECKELAIRLALACRTMNNL